MAYLGNTPTQQGFIPAIDFFSGNGSTVAFTLSRPVASVAQVQATIENVPQNPGTAFTVSGNTITFDGAPASGTNNIYVYYTSPITTVIQPGQGTVGTAQIANGVTVNFADGSAAAPSITNLDDTNTGMFFPAADTIAFAEGGVEVARFDSSGNLGIGINSPNGKLAVFDNVASPVTVAVNNNSASTSAGTRLGFYYQGTLTGYILNQFDGGDFQNVYSSNGISRFLIAGTERMRLNGSGNLLLGTTSVGSMGASSQPVVFRAGRSGIINAVNDNVANNSTLEITVSSGGGGIAGILVVQNILLSTANSRTQTTFSVLGRGTDAAASQITTRNGSLGGASFSVTFPSAGLIRITNTSGGATSITASFFGNEGF